MNETKFTPGPWKIGAYESGRMAVDGANDEEVTGYIDPEDAYLIAAAPDLYEALETVLANAPEPYCAITRAVDAKCRAALAKARGEL
jgi:hypothetical protein